MARKKFRHTLLGRLLNLSSNTFGPGRMRTSYRAFRYRRHRRAVRASIRRRYSDWR